jgi:hypothetical protein
MVRMSKYTIHNTIAQPSNTAVALLHDASIVTITVTQAAAIIGVSAAAAHRSHRRTGYILDGVPVLRVGRRCVVSTAAMRRALSMPEPQPVANA